jgi:hypothetical protein
MCTVGTQEIRVLAFSLLLFSVGTQEIRVLAFSLLLFHSSIHLLISSFNKYLLNTYYVPGTLLCGAVNQVDNKQKKKLKKRNTLVNSI